MEKFSQGMSEQLFYGAFSVFGYITVSTQPWAWHPEHMSALWWRDWSTTVASPFPESEGVPVSATSYITRALAAYYIMYAARYFQGLISVFLEHRRKDFWQMVAHHAVTFSVVSLSYTVRCLLTMCSEDVFAVGLESCWSDSHATL